MALVVLKALGAGDIASDSYIIKRQSTNSIEAVESALVAGRELARIENIAWQDAIKQEYADLEQKLELQSVEEKINALGAYSDSLALFQDKVAKRFVDTVMASLHSLLGAELPAHFFSHAVSTAAELVGDPCHVEVLVSVDDSQKASDALSNLTLPSKLKSITVCIDRSLYSGQCYVRTPLGQIDLHLETQLDSLRRSLMQWQENGATNANRRFV
jgi:flagellar biosynthesis/type III secretory pathway protein FliH